MKLSGSQWQVLLVVIRKTYGWGKLEDSISLSQFQKETGLTKAMICRCLKELVYNRILVVVYNRILASRYRFEKNWENWTLGSIQTVKIGSIQSYTHKRKDIQKKYIKKKIEFSKRTIWLAKKLNTQPRESIEKYTTDLYCDYSIKEPTLAMLAWCEEKKVEPSFPRWINWMRKAKKSNELELL